MKALITGAASGIGAAVSRRLAADAVARGETARLALLDYAEEALRGVVEHLNRSPGVEAAAIVGDLSDPAGLSDAIAAALDFTGGELDALVSNAGVVRPSTLAELSLDQYDFDFAVNTRATFLLAQGCREALARSGGCIVATGSLSGSAPTADLGAYSASKAAVIMLVKQLAREWGPDGIRVNSVSPGAVHTSMTHATYSDQKAVDARAAQIPLGRVGEPEDIAAAIAFLTGPDAAYVTGVNLPVDGGWASALMPQAAAARRSA